MPRPMRILYVTISNWGVGDELALNGTLKVMEKRFPGHLKFFAEKNEELRALPDKPFKSDVWNKALCDFLPDLIVQAGGNQWTGPNHAQWEDMVIGNGIPIIYLGVGMSNPKADKAKTEKVLARCPLFIGRDHVAVSEAKNRGARKIRRLCCPSLFVAEEAPGGEGVGLVFQAHTIIAPHSCSKELQEDEIDLFRRICGVRPTRIICHFIGDYAAALHHFAEWKDRIVYSKVLADYIRWYSECSVIMSMRLHGAYLGATLGKPTVCLKADNDKCCALPEIGVPVMPPSKAKSNDPSLLSDPPKTEAIKAKYRAAYEILLGELTIGVK